MSDLKTSIQGRRGYLGGAWLLAVLGLTGCGETVDPQPLQASGSTLCYVDYQTCINPILDAAIVGRTGSATCSSSGCHALGVGSGGAFKINALAPPDSEEMLANFFASKAFANLDSPDDSKLLLEPLQGSASVTGTHTGGDIFPSTGDVCYQTIRTWISQRVEDEYAETCGSCTLPDLTQCGY